MISETMTTRQALKILQLQTILPRLFGEMDEEMFHTILSLLEWKELPGNQYLFQQGTVGNSLYILISGRLKAVIKRSDGSEKMVGEITRGETVGEMALFTGEARTASIVSIRDSVLVRISKQAFTEISARYPKVVMNITRLIINRLKRRNVEDRGLHKVVNIALVPLSKGINISQFAEKLTKKMSRFGNILSLSADRINQKLLKDGIAQAQLGSDAYHQLSAWLDEKEAKHDYLIYQAESEPTEWSKRCLRQADEILLIADARDTPQLTKIEARLLNGPQKITTAEQVLIKLHPRGDTEIMNTAEWLSFRTLKAHHHLKRGQPKDIERLARFMTDKAIGLVLSGGGAKGLAHIGVCRALEEYNIPVDTIGGTSIGSIIGGFMAKGWSSKDIIERTRAAFLANPTPLRDYNLLPLVSLLKGKKLDQLLDRYIGHYFIEDLPLNFFCISSNLTKTQAAIHHKGSLCQSIRASISLPGIFPPAILKNELHVDGGIFNNLPIDVMEEKGIGRTIAVDFDKGNDQEFGLETIPSTWQIIKSKLLGRQNAAYIPSLMSTIIQSTKLNSDQKTRRSRTRADIFINPDLTKYGLIEWKAFDKIVEIGYRDAVKVLEEWEGF